MGPQDPGMTGPDEDPLRKLPPVPPEDAHLHVMVDYREALDNTLAKLLLLDVCEGRDAPECATIIDYPLHEFPRPDPATYGPDPASQSAYRKELGWWLGKAKENAENDAKRQLITYKKRTEACTLLVASCSPNVTDLGKEICRMCDCPLLSASSSLAEPPGASCSNIGN